jgi:hypothetical protein
MENDLASQLIALELRLQSPAIRQDRTALRALLCEDFREFGASGRIWDRESILNALSNEPAIPITCSNFECVRLAPDVALLTYRARRADRETLRSSLWRRDSAGWRVLFHQGTVIPAGLVAAAC